MSNSDRGDTTIGPSSSPATSIEPHFGLIDSLKIRYADSGGV